MQSPVGFHIALKTVNEAAPFTRRDSCVKAWNYLRQLFPECIAASLMPDHLHILAWPENLEELCRKSRLIRQGLRRLFPGSEWEPLSDPRAIPNVSHLLRQIRYVHLNPCRDELCADPLEWEWSTHRELFGAVSTPWIRVQKIQAKLGSGWTGTEGLKRLHRYISGDPSVHPLGTLPPRSATEISAIRLGDILSVAARAQRCTEGDLVRKGKLRAQTTRVLQQYFNLPGSQIGPIFGVDRRSPTSGSSDTRSDLILFEAMNRILNEPRFLRISKNPRFGKF